MNNKPEYTFEFRTVSWAILIISYLPFFGMGIFVLRILFKIWRFDNLTQWGVTFFFIGGLLYAFFRFLHILSTANRVDFFKEHLSIKGLLFQKNITYSEIVRIKKSAFRPKSIDLIYSKGSWQKSVNIIMEWDIRIQEEIDYAKKFLDLLYLKTKSYAKFNEEELNKKILVNKY